MNCIVTIAEFSEAEAANSLKAVNLIEKVVVLAIVESKARASEQVHLDGVLDGLCRVDETDKLVRAEHIVRVGVELLH